MTRDGVLFRKNVKFPNNFIKIKFTKLIPRDSDQIWELICLLMFYENHTSYPGEDTVLHHRGEGPTLGGVGGQVPPYDVFYPLRCQDQQDWNMSDLRESSSVRRIGNMKYKSREDFSTNSTPQHPHTKENYWFIDNNNNNNNNNNAM